LVFSVRGSVSFSLKLADFQASDGAHNFLQFSGKSLYFGGNVFSRWIN